MKYYKPSLGRQNKPTTVNELKLGENNLTNPKGIAGGVNDCFLNIGLNLASQINTQNLNFELYVKKTESEFASCIPACQCKTRQPTSY